MNKRLCVYMFALAAAQNSLGAEQPTKVDERLGSAPVFVVKRVDLERPIIKADEIPVPTSGVVRAISGEVLRATSNGWQPLKAGDTLSHGALVQMQPGSILDVEFGAGNVKRFAAEGKRTLAIAVK